MKEISVDTDQRRDLQDYEDFVYAFFQNCFHLKDWIINSGIIDKNIVDAFIESNTDMKICRDLCNGSKHLTINNPSIDPDILMNVSKFSISVGGFKENKIACWVHVDQYPPLDALALAENCLTLWHIFLKQHSLLDNNPD